MTTLFIRTAIIYLLLILTIRLMGKRQIGELQLSELVTTFMLSELAVTPIQDSSVPLSFAILPILFLLSAEVILSYLIMRFDSLKKLLCGKPSILVRNGKIDQKELARMRIGTNELLSELRQKDVADVRDVSYAILEENGKLSVFLRASKDIVTPEDLELAKEEHGLPHPIILDGRKSDVNMRLSGVTDEKLQAELKKQKLRITDIFLMTADDAGNYNIIKKESK